MIEFINIDRPLAQKRCVRDIGTLSPREENRNLTLKLHEQE